jgi:predicted nucleic-acid-binding protein
MKQLLLDSNVILRFLLADDPKQSPDATKIFGAAARGACLLHLDPLIVAECVYVLMGEFDRDRKFVASALGQIAEGAGVDTNQKPVLLEALRRFSETRVDFQDAWLAAKSVAAENQVASFDRDFDKFADVTRFEPGRDSL